MTATQPNPQTARLKLLIRARRPQDADAVAELCNLPGVRFGTMQLPFRSPEDVRGFIDKAAPGDTYLVAMAEGTLVGSSSLHRQQGRRGHMADLGIMVHDDWTGQGIGTALLAALVDTAERWLGLRRLQLTVYVDNKPAIALYQRFAFVVEGTHRAFGLRDGQFVDAQTMARVTL